MQRKPRTVAERRDYAVLDVAAARELAAAWLRGAQLENAVDFGLPEVDDRYHVWRVPLLGRAGKNRIGEVVIDARSARVMPRKSTDQKVLERRLMGGDDLPNKRMHGPREVEVPGLAPLSSTIALGDCEEVLADLPAGSVDLVFTSPPYYNARPEYTDYVTYEDYLQKLRRVIRGAHRVLAEGRFFVMNVAPVLVRRANRSQASRRIAVPFDVHRIFIEEGFDFMDDIIWVKPEGAGWATGRGRRFAADRNPLQYKPVPVTEYILVYRRHTEKLIDWNIRSHPRPDFAADSRIGDDYARTNVWRIKPAHDKRHPAVFPAELAERVISYYSFKGDLVLDPFAGIGTVGKVATRLGRRYFLIEQDPTYFETLREEASVWTGADAERAPVSGCPVPEDDLA